VQQLFVGDSLIRSKKKRRRHRRDGGSSSSTTAHDNHNDDEEEDEDDGDNGEDSMNMSELEQEVVAINVAEIADYIVAKQQRIGTLVKVEGQDDAFGFLSVAHAQRHKVAIQHSIAIIRSHLIEALQSFVGRHN